MPLSVARTEKYGAGKTRYLHGGKQNFDPYILSYMRINSKGITDLNIKAQTGSGDIAQKHSACLTSMRL